jgi:hypothetical protein
MLEGGMDDGPGGDGAGAGRRLPGMLNAKPEDVANQASRASINHLIRRTVGVINQIRIAGTHPTTGQRSDSEVPGTGCPVLWGDKTLLVTAKHVVETVSSASDLRIATFAQTAVVFKDPERVTWDDAEAGVVLGSDSQIHLCGWEDLAAITVHAGNFPHCDFADIRDEWIDPPEGETVHCCGFPSDHNVTVETKIVNGKVEIGVGLLPTIFDGKVLPRPTENELKFRITAFDADHHYLIPYASSASKHPAGYSGAAMWWEMDEQMTVWRPRFKFAGICVCTYKDGTVIQVIRASVVRRFLEETFGPNTHESAPERTTNK